MNELPNVVSGFLVGSICVCVTAWILLGPPVYRFLIASIPISAALAGLSVSKALVLPASVTWALSAGIWTATTITLVIFLLRLPDIAGPLADEDGADPAGPRSFKRGLAIVTVLAAAGGLHLANLLGRAEEGVSAPSAALSAVRSWLSGLSEAVRGMGRPSASGLLLAAAIVALLVVYLRWRGKRGYHTSQWPTALASGVTGALVFRAIAGEDLVPTFESGPRLLGAVAAIVLLALFLVSLARGDRPGFDSYTGGLGDGLGGWRITPSLAYLIGALALTAVFLTGGTNESQESKGSDQPVASGSAASGEGESATDPGAEAQTELMSEDEVPE